MKECKRCHISFATSESVCPLCQNALVGTCDDLVFPTNIRFRTNRFLVQLFLFISLVVFIIAGFIELMLSARLYYSLFILAGLATNFILVTYVLLNKQDILDLFGKYGLILVLLSLLWYVITKNTIITNYIIPSFCIFELLFNLISFIVLKNHYIVGYLKILLLNLFLLIILDSVLPVFKLINLTKRETLFSSFKAFQILSANSSIVPLIPTSLGSPSKLGRGSESHLYV